MDLENSSFEALLRLKQNDQAETSAKNSDFLVQDGWWCVTPMTFFYPWL